MAATDEFMERDSVLIIEPDTRKAEYLAHAVQQLLDKLNEEDPESSYLHQAEFLQRWTEKEYAADPLRTRGRNFKIYDRGFMGGEAKEPYVQSLPAGFDELLRDCGVLLELGAIAERHTPGLLPRSILINLDDFEREHLQGRTYKTDKSIISLIETAIFLNLNYRVLVLGLIGKDKAHLCEYADFPVWCPDYATWVQEHENDKREALIPPWLEIYDREWTEEEQREWKLYTEPVRTLEHRIKTDERVNFVFRKDRKEEQK